MPTYEYKCDTCAHQFEYFQSMTALSLKNCPECGASLRRLITAGGGIILKGNGFYQTDYKNSASREKTTDSKTGMPAPCEKVQSCPSAGKCPAAG